MDRRVDVRLDIKLRCYVALPSGSSRRFVGLTENMSRNGMLVSWRWEELSQPQSLPQPGDVLTAEIELPASRHFGRRCMHCQVTVVRVATEAPGRARVAFRVNHMQFRNYATGRFAPAGLEDVLGRSQQVM